MSVGNLKDSGNQGNNLPFQLKMLQGLQALLDGNCCKDITSLLENKERFANILRSSTSGTIPKCYSFSIANIGSANGTYNGATIAPGEIVNFDAGVLNNQFASAPFDATGTTFLITYVN